MAQVSTARLTFGSILGMVSTTAQAVTSTVGMISNGVSTLDAIVQGYADEQKIRSIASKESTLDRILGEVTMEATERDLMTLDYCAKSTAHRDRYQANQSRFQAALAAAGYTSTSSVPATP